MQSAAGLGSPCLWLGPPPAAAAAPPAFCLAQGEQLQKVLTITRACFRPWMHDMGARLGLLSACALPHFSFVNMVHGHGYYAQIMDSQSGLRLQLIYLQ